MAVKPPVNRPSLSVVENATRSGDLEVDLSSNAATVAENVVCLRSDLHVTPGRGDTVVVKAPENTSSFQLYRMEWQVAGLMDGVRTIPEIVREMARLGVPVTAELVRSFIKELKGYGFLAEAATQGGMARPRLNTDPSPPLMSAEEEQLLTTALAMESRGDIAAAVNYLNAVLQISPDNRYAENHLKRLSALDTDSVDARLAETPNGPATPAKPEQPPIPPKPRSSTPKAIVIGGLVAAVASGGGIFAWMASRGNPAGPTNAEAPKGSVGDGAAKTAAPREVYRFFTPLEAGRRIPVNATRRVTVVEVSVTSGQSVKAGDRLVVLGDPGAQQKIAKLAKTLEGLERKAKKNPTFRDFAMDTRRRLEALKKGAEPEIITAPISGRVGRMHAKVDASIAAGQPFLELEDPAELVASVPRRGLPFAPNEVTCAMRLEGATTIDQGCSLGADDKSDEVRIVVANRQGLVEPGQVVQIIFQEKPGAR